jgi:hypothetical protein
MKSVPQLVVSPLYLDPGTISTSVAANQQSPNGGGVGSGVGVGVGSGVGVGVGAGVGVGFGGPACVVVDGLGFGESPAIAAIAFAALMRMLVLVCLALPVSRSPLASRAALIASMDKFGLKDFINPTNPATCGVAMEVPDAYSYPPPTDAERISVPGAAISTVSP